jgi:ATP-binding cassette subfamily G (WHITE) protein 2
MMCVFHSILDLWYLKFSWFAHTSQAKGDVRLNGQPYTNTELKWMSAYVMQDDLLNGNLTVEETLLFNAELRMAKESTSADIRERVESVMKDMHIGHVRDVIVGTALKKGISGGERKRLCVAIELLTKPVLLFLDEPTSGLDSVAALQLCTRLKELCDSRVCTVVCTIHQPQVGWRPCDIM